VVYRAWLHFSACSCDVLDSIMFCDNRRILLKIKYMGGKGPLQGMDSKEWTARNGQQPGGEGGRPYGAAQCWAWDWTGRTSMSMQATIPLTRFILHLHS
jgi:hypothetical protein